MHAHKITVRFLQKKIFFSPQKEKKQSGQAKCVKVPNPVFRYFEFNHHHCKLSLNLLKLLVPNQQLFVIFPIKICHKDFFLPPDQFQRNNPLQHMFTSYNGQRINVYQKAKIKKCSLPPLSFCLPTLGQNTYVYPL